MSLIMNAQVREDLLKAHREEAEFAGDLGTEYSNRIIEAITNLPDGVPLDSVERPEISFGPEDEQTELGDLESMSDAEVVVTVIDFHYGNFTPEGWVS